MARGKRHFSCTLHAIAELYSFRIYFTEPQGYFFASEHHGSHFSGSPNLRGRVADVLNYRPPEEKES